MKCAFKDIYPALQETNNEGAKRRLAGLIINQEKDLAEYASNWAKSRNEAQQLRALSPASGSSPQSFKQHIDALTNEGLSPIAVSGFGDGYGDTI